MPKIKIFYDGDCPFCKSYVHYLRLMDAASVPELIDLRQAESEKIRLSTEGFNLDQGMVVDIDGKYYDGGNAMHVLALLTTKSGIFNRLNVLVFSIPFLATFLYPLLRGIRNATLLMLGRMPLQTSEVSRNMQAQLTIFSMILGLFGVIHFFIYALKYESSDMYLSTWLILPLGLANFLQPGSKRFFVLFIIVLMIDGWLQMPMYSNHTILLNFLLLGFLLGGIYHWLKGSHFYLYFSDIVPIGQALLLIMYFFGIFHKINSGFLNPEVSCAVALWKLMPWPLNLINGFVMDYLVIYGTFAIEGIIIVMLLVPTLRHYGIVTGIGFHMLLALSGYAMYPAFSTITIVLHTLFILPTAAARIVESPLYKKIMARLNSPMGFIFLVILFAAIIATAAMKQYAIVGLLWFLLAGLISLSIVLYGGRKKEDTAQQSIVAWSPLIWLNLVTALFFFNCITPYLGLKNTQAMNMFANLRLEGGQSNHLILSHKPGPFQYLEDIVTIETAENSRYLSKIKEKSSLLPYYHLLSILEQNPDIIVTFLRNDKIYRNQSAATLTDDIEKLLHPQWFRKWFHFRSRSPEMDPPCSK